MLNLLQYTYTEFCDQFKLQIGRGTYHAKALYRQIFQQGRLAPLELAEYQASPELARKVRAQWSLVLDPVVAEHREAELIKFVTRLHDGLEIESVIVPMTRYATLCVSSQAGCRMGCVFCRTAAQGLARNLSVSEIVAQVITARRHYGAAIRNIVFMGMGEPLDNLDNVIQAIRVMAQPHGLNIPHSHVTLSTVGLPQGLAHLANLNWPRLNLAISLNAADDTLRRHLMPVAAGLTLDALQSALLNYPLKKFQVFLISYILFQGLNDTPMHARRLADWVAPLPVRINLIAFNVQPQSSLQPSSRATEEAFRQELVARKMFVRRRTVRGGSVLAACGQLGRIDPPFGPPLGARIGLG